MISHDADADMNVIVAMASDEDDGNNGRVSYEILRGNPGWAGMCMTLFRALMI